MSNVDSDAPTSRGQAGSYRILITDDNVDAADALGMLLTAWGHDTKVVYSATEALEEAEHFKPDVALLDLGLPVMDGYELAGRLRERMGSDAPVLIAISGYALDCHRTLSKSAGFDAHLAKPVDYATLSGLLKELLPRS